MTFCYNTFITHYAIDGLNKGNLKALQVTAPKENKEQPNIIPIYGKKILHFFDDTVLQILERVESKKAAILNPEKDKIFERKHTDEVIKK